MNIHKFGIFIKKYKIYFKISCLYFFFGRDGEDNLQLPIITIAEEYDAIKDDMLNYLFQIYIYIPIIYSVLGNNLRSMNFLKV